MNYCTSSLFFPPIISLLYLLYKGQKQPRQKSIPYILYTHTHTHTQYMIHIFYILHVSYTQTYLLLVSSSLITAEEGKPKTTPHKFGDRLNERK